MTIRKLTIIVGTIALSAAAVVVAAVVVVVAGFLLKDQSEQLNRSLEVLLREHLKLTSARVTQTALTGRKDTDASGYWSVVVVEEPSKVAIALRDAGFGQSYDDDERYFRSLLQRELNGGDLARYHAFEADLPLGDGTICETLPCNVVILFSDESPTVFVAIWKI